MSFWVHAFCNESVAAVTAEELAGGIAERLKMLTYLFCPDEEEDPEVVLARLKVEDKSTDGTFRVFLLHYRADSPLFIHVARNEDRCAVEEVEEKILSKSKQPGVMLVREMLSNVKEDISFALTASDVNSMGFPLSIAAASYLVKRAGGLIQSGYYSWMVPSGREVKIIAEIKA